MVFCSGYGVFFGGLWFSVGVWFFWVWVGVFCVVFVFFGVFCVGVLFWFVCVCGVLKVFYMSCGFVFCGIYFCVVFFFLECEVFG